MNRPAEDLHTVRDLLRFAVTRFNIADLAYGHGTDTAIDDAVYLILEALRLPIDDIGPWLDARLALFERERILSLIDQRVTTRKPTPYLVNRAYIQGVPFFVDERVIVPRSFIAEILAETTEDDASTLFGPLSQITAIADICTGSGCLAILAARLFPFATVDAVDLSSEALEVAAINVAALGDGRVSLFEGDLFDPLGDSRYDLIISNPPYVDAETMETLPPEYRREPELALAGGFDGLDIVRKLLEDVPGYLTDNGFFICEIGSGREILEAEYPDLAFQWLDTEESEGEVFVLSSDAFGEEIDEEPDFEAIP